MTYRVPTSVAALVLAVLSFAMAAVHRDALPLSHGAERRAEQIAGLSQARVFIPDGAGGWLQPVPLYTTRVVAAFGAADPIRTASMVVAALNVAILLLLAQAIFNDLRISMAAAILLALAPAHLVLARTAAESMFTVPFVLVWCLAQLHLLKTQHLTWAALAGTALGLGFFSAPTGPITVTVLAGLTAALMWRQPHRVSAIAATGASMVLVVGVGLAIGLAVDHAPLVETIGRWWIHPAHVVNPIEGFESIVNRTSASVRVGRYWHVFNPVELFLPGTSATAPPFIGHSPFGLGYLALLLLGVPWIRQTQPTAWRAIALAILVMPIAAVTFDDVTIVDVAALVPLLVIVAAGGVARCLTETTRWARVIGVLSGLAVVAQSAWLLL